MNTAAELRRSFRGLRTEGGGTARETAAVACGVFIGCLPVYGLHFALCWAVGLLLGLNRLKMYVAANISNPLIAPWLIFSEVQIGALLRHGAFYPLSSETLASTGLATFGFDALVGSVVVGGCLATVAAAGTYSLVRGGDRDQPFATLVARAADRYVRASVTAWEFARGKLRFDPVYRAALDPALLPSGGTLLDVGCGQGLMLALLAEAAAAATRGEWPSAVSLPPRFDRLVGVETRQRAAAIARGALAGDATIIADDARTAALEPARVVLLFDVLHLIPRADQDLLLASLVSRLERGGVLLVREVDAGAGWRFTAVRVVNRMKAFVLGTWRRQVFDARTADEWRTCFAALGLTADVRPMGQGTPFGNVLLRVSAAPAASAEHRRPSQPV